MNGVKSSSFNVKDLLDLPETKPSCAGVPGDPESLALNAVVPDITHNSAYYDSDNPYTRWLQNNDNIQYSGKINVTAKKHNKVVYKER